MKGDLLKRCKEHAKHLSEISGVSGCVLSTIKRVFLYSSNTHRFCEECTCSRCNELNTHLYGCNEAYRWNGQYIYYCPLGLVFTASSVSDDTGNMVGGMIMGPLLMGDCNDVLNEMTDSMHSKAVNLPMMTTAKVTDLAAILSAVTAYAAGLPHSRVGGFIYQQEKLLNAIYSAQDKMLEGDTTPVYPIETEKKLHNLICSHDKSGAQEMLNELLGHIYCSNNFDLSAIKTRVVELVVVLSRATIDAGADIREVFLFNTNYIQEIEQFSSLEELSVWLNGIMHRFIAYSFDFAQVKHSNVVYKVMEYVKANYNQKISLDDIARHVYLSRSYLSSIFKEETGESLFSYINRVRIEKSKMYLLDNAVSLVDIASICGFEDQSYFTRVFKKATGVSPMKYRSSRGNTTLL
ncbi:MAG: AraC family transcriptional regulator [Oscillospiraceae bacterium]|nr:AraC family transcriptional regulator [Oscillospiraceae bacterium]MDD4414305.1 AraC family transcriptional regulator [Oscillospiraceae bacterium]